ncbi:MAG: trimethylamine methyltransferase family protein [Pseudomonadota bacterium]
MSQRARRSGGRQARQALRAAPLTEDIRPVRAGLESSSYKPLSQAQIEQIHETALKALAEIGLADAPPSGVELLTKAGAIEGEDKRIRFPRKVVEHALNVACKKITLYSRNGRNDMELWGDRVHFGTAGAAVNMVDVEKNEYRESTVQDLFDAAKIVNSLENVHFFQRPMVCRDIPDNREMDLNTIYAACRGTTKHIGTSFTEPSFVPDALELVYEIAGGEQAYREKPFLSNSNCFVVPPMKFATESCEVMEACIRGGMPVLLLSAGMAGATTPSTIAGALVQSCAECLAGLVYVNAIEEGHPAIFGTWPFGLDLRTGAMSIGSGEQALLSAACAQMHKFYGLPGGAAAGASDSKMPDMQAGWEQMNSNVMVGLAGLNMVYEAAGMHASLLGFCHESLILSEDLIGQAMRCIRGIEVTEETLALDQIADVCQNGPGHYLGTDQTLSRMQADYVYPIYGDRTSPKEWAENGKPDLIAKAIEKKNEILSKPSAAEFDAELDSRLRQMIKIHLPV